MCSVTQQFCCEHCNYKTNREYNLTRHVILKHSDNKKYFSCIECNKTFSTVFSLQRHVKTNCNGLLNKNSTNLTDTQQNCSVTQQSTTCEYCHKTFTTSEYLKKHYDGRCKGVHNPLECPVCTKTFASRQSKQRHMKTCYIRSPSSDHAIHHVTNNNTTTNISGDSTVNHIQTQNNTQNTGISIQGDVIIYNDRLLTFNDDHIDKGDLERIFDGASVKTLEAIASYALKLLENPSNRCVRKKHITNSYCEVYQGEGNWICRPDKTVVVRFSQDIASSANDKLYDYPDIGDKKVREEITSIASYDEEAEKNKGLVKELRSLLVQVSRETDIKNKKVD